MRVIGLLGLILCVGGCTPAILRHDTKSAQDFEKDSYECGLVSDQAVKAQNVVGSPWAKKVEMEKCLTMRYGWKK